MNQAMRHYGDSVFILAYPQEIFSFIDDHSRISSHMSKSSWMTGGGRMDVSVDAGCGQKIGSHIQLKGRAFGIPLFLDEVVTLYEQPYRKEWETVGIPKLLVIGHYRMGVEINAEKKGAWLKVFIDYELPESWRTRWLGYLFSRIYARWCVRQMLQDVRIHFEK